MWVVHREELRRQAKDSFEKFANAFGRPELPGRIDILMLSEVGRYLSANHEIRFAVIDEAHHVAAKSYQKLFERTELGILGLTATPSRHDGQPLQFERESYSIGFPDLVGMGVLLRPNVIRIEGGTYDIEDIGEDSDSLEVFNNTERNTQILAALAANSEKLRKIIIYVGTKKHALDLYQLLKSSSLAGKYEAVSIILGNERRRYICETNEEISGETRANFIEAQKSLHRSLLINVDVLTEGYDDPTVNAVLMARPTSSKLVYMQAIGRAVRMNPHDSEKEAFVIEVSDNLPNIRYRIDNRWLYSDISDLLEPNVIDIKYATPEKIADEIRDAFDKYNVALANRIIPDFRSRDRITMLLFKTYIGDDRYAHVPLVITNDTRQAAAAFFNFLASRIGSLHALDIEQVFRPVLAQTQIFAVLGDVDARRHVFNAMENAWELVRPKGEKCSAGIEAGRPWITFIAFRLEMTADAFGYDLLRFTDDMLNKERFAQLCVPAALQVNSSY